MCAAVMVLWCMLAPLHASAEQFTCKVVGISDGDTISVLREGKVVKVRLYGIDAVRRESGMEECGNTVGYTGTR